LKHLIASLFIGLFLTGMVVAQSAGLRSFRQIGSATAELGTDQLVASHPSLSMGTQLKVTNTANGKEAIVTVTGRIPASGTRIVDVSRGVAARLEMNESGTTPVTIEVLRNTEVAAAPEPEPVREEPVTVAEAEPEPEPVREEPKPREEKPGKQEPAAAPVPVTIYNTITVQAKTPAEPSVAASTPAPAGQQAAPVIVAPLYKPVAAPVIVAAPVYSRSAVPCPPAVPAQMPVAAIPVQLLVTPVQGQPQQVNPPAQVQPRQAPCPPVQISTPVQPQFQCPPAQASAGYIVSSQIVYSQVPAYRQVQPQGQPCLQAQQAPAAYSQPQAPVQTQTVQQPVSVSTTPPQALQGSVTVYTATVPASQAPVPALQTGSGVEPGGTAAVIKPRMPDPASSGVYRVQVGSYADPQNAQTVAESLVRAGLCPAYEQYGQIWRVVIPGINAQQVSVLAQQLGALGIGEVWIRQEG
jgi:rare lipoprotein A